MFLHPFNHADHQLKTTFRLTLSEFPRVLRNSTRLCLETDGKQNKTYKKTPTTQQWYYWESISLSQCNKSTLSNFSGWASPISLPSNSDTLITFSKDSGMKDSNVCLSHLNLRLSYSLQ